MPATVPAVLEIPMTTPACRGAMSMWLTENPPRANPASPRVALVAISPAVTERAIGMASKASPAPQNPAGRSRWLKLQAVYVAPALGLQLYAVKTLDTKDRLQHHVLPMGVRHPAIRGHWATS